MAEKNSRRNETTDALFDAILSLESREECYAFFEDLCTVKEISDMAQRLQAAKLLLDGATYEQIVKAVEISTATISRANQVPPIIILFKQIRMENDFSSFFICKSVIPQFNDNLV